MENQQELSVQLLENKEQQSMTKAEVFELKLKQLQNQVESAEKVETSRNLELKEWEALKQSKKTVDKHKEELQTALTQLDTYQKEIRELEMQVDQVEKDREEASKNFERESRRTGESFLEGQELGKVTEIGQEIIRCKGQLESLHRDLDEKREIADELLKSIASAEQDRLAGIEELETTSVPFQITQQAEILIRKLGVIHRDLETKDDQLQATNQECERWTQKRDLVADGLSEIQSEVEHRRLGVVQLERKIESILKDYELTRQKFLASREDRLSLDSRLKASLANISATNEALMRIKRENNDLTKTCSKVESQIITMKGFVPYIRENSDKLDQELKKLKRDLETMREERGKVETEIETSLLKYLYADESDEATRNVLRGFMLENSKIDRESAESRKELDQLTNLVSKLYLEKQIKVREYHRLLEKKEVFGREIETRQNQADDTQRRYHYIYKKSEDMEKILETLKSEKNHHLHLIHLSKQRKLEIQEKEHLISNELALLRSEFEGKQMEDEKISGKLEKSVSSCTRIRVELNRLMVAHRKQKEAVEKEEISTKQIQRKLESFIKQMNNSTKSLKRATLLCESSALHLLERNRELGFLSTRVTAFETEVRDMERKVCSKEEDVKQLENVKKDIEIDILLEKNRLHKEINTRDRWKSLQDELGGLFQVEEELKQEYAQMALSDESNDKIRFLQGSDKSVEELKQIALDLERRMSKRNAAIEEKRAILDDLEQRIKEHELKSKEPKGEHESKYWKLHEMQAKSSELDSQIISTLSELGMNQKLATEMRQEMQNLERTYQDKLIEMTINSSV